MQKKTKFDPEGPHRLLLSLIVFGLIATFFFLSFQNGTQAGSSQKVGQDISQPSESRKKDLENYDIRTDKNESRTLLNFHHSEGINAARIADARAEFFAAEKLLRQKISNLKVEYNEHNLTPEVIAPDIKQGRSALSKPSFENRPEILRGFLKQNNRLLGISDEQAERIETARDYTNPDGNLSFRDCRNKIRHCFTCSRSRFDNQMLFLFKRPQNRFRHFYLTDSVFIILVIFGDNSAYAENFFHNFLLIF
jgi:hypothetical protein